MRNSSNSRFNKIESLVGVRLEKISHHVHPFKFLTTNMGIKSLKYVWSKGYYAYRSYWTSRFFEREIFWFKNVLQNYILNNWYNSITRLNLVVPLESTPSPHYEWKGKRKDYHYSRPSETYYIHANCAPYLYEYEGIIPLLITNNSGINGAESKWDFDLTLLMNHFNEYTRHNYTTSGNREALSTSKIHNPLEVSKEYY